MRNRQNHVVSFLGAKTASRNPLRRHPSGSLHNVGESSGVRQSQSAGARANLHGDTDMFQSDKFSIANFTRNHSMKCSNAHRRILVQVEKNSCMVTECRNEFFVRLTSERRGPFYHDAFWSAVK